MIELAEAEYKKILDEEENELNKSYDSNIEVTTLEENEGEEAMEEAMNKLSEHILKTKVELVPYEEQRLNEIFDSDNSNTTDCKSSGSKKKCHICQRICTGAFDLKIHECVHHCEKKGLY